MDSVTAQTPQLSMSSFKKYMFTRLSCSAVSEAFHINSIHHSMIPAVLAPLHAPDPLQFLYLLRHLKSYSTAQCTTKQVRSVWEE